MISSLGCLPLSKGVSMYLKILSNSLIFRTVAAVLILLLLFLLFARTESFSSDLLRMRSRAVRSRLIAVKSCCLSISLQRHMTITLVS